MSWGRRRGALASEPPTARKSATNCARVERERAIWDRRRATTATDGVKVECYRQTPVNQRHATQPRSDGAQSKSAGIVPNTTFPTSARLQSRRGLHKNDGVWETLQKRWFRLSLNNASARGPLLSSVASSIGRSVVTRQERGKEGGGGLAPNCQMPRRARCAAGKVPKRRL